MISSLDHLADRLAQFACHERAHGRPHATSLCWVQAGGGHLVAIAVDDTIVARGEARELHRAVSECAREFGAYVDLLDGLERTARAVDGVGAANANGATAPVNGGR